MLKNAKVEIKCRTENGFLIKIFCFILSYSASFIWKARSHKTIYKAPDTALRISAREEPLPSSRTAVSEAL